MSLPLVAAALGLLLASIAVAQPSPEQFERVRNSFDKPTAEACALLDDPIKGQIIDGLRLYLTYACDRADLLGFVEGGDYVEGERGAFSEPDVAVSDPSGDSGSQVQNETAIARNEVTGTLCSGYNDSFHGVTQNQGFSGFSRSTDDGASFTDQGPLGPGNGGDPSIVWRRADGAFYYAVLASGSLGLWKSTDDCESFTNIGNLHNGTSDDKELMAVDNNPMSPHYGNLYVAWTDFGAGGAIFSTRSTDAGVTWETPVQISANGADVQGAWPVVAPNGDVFVGWVRWNPFPNGPTDFEVVRSTDGGQSFAAVTNPATGVSNPTDAAAQAACGRPALNGNVRYLPSPQLAVGPDGALHIVYSYDEDNTDADEIDVFYRRSTDSGATWGPQIQINDDTTDTDQFFPTLSVGETNIVSIAFYDRRNDAAANLLVDYYQALSFDGGVTWEPNTRLSDESSPITLDGNLAACYHGDYDQQLQIESAAVLQWADDRAGNPDVFSDQVALSTDFLVTATPSSFDLCTLPSRGGGPEYTINVLQFEGFTDPVTLTAAGQPTGTSPNFSANPVTPPNTSQLTLNNPFSSPAGDYEMTVTGTSNLIVHDTTVDLHVFDQIPTATMITAPTDGQTNVPVAAVITWNDSTQASSWDIEIATDSGFTNIVESASVAGLEYTTEGLDSATEYWARVRPANVCGAGGYTMISFTTVPLPGDCLPGALILESFDDDFETGAPGWSTGGTGSTWALSSTQVNSGTMAWHADNVDDVSDQFLISPSIDVPQGQTPNLQFWNRQELEDGGSACYDGGVLEISTNGGSTWQRLEAELLNDPYDGPIDDGFSNPLANENAWCGDPQEWLRSVVDLTAFAGQSVQFRWRLATDSSVGHPGWDIDDVRVRACLMTEIFADAFESGDATVWSNSSP